MKMMLIGIYQSEPMPGNTRHWFLRVTNPTTGKYSEATLFEKQARELIAAGIPQLPDGSRVACAHDCETEREE